MGNGAIETGRRAPSFGVLRVMVPGLLLFLVLSLFFGFYFAFSEAVRRELRTLEPLVLDFGGAGRHAFLDTALIALALGMAGSYFYHLPLVRHFRALRRGERPSEAERARARRRALRSPAVMAFLTPAILCVLALGRLLLGGRGNPESPLAVMLPIELAVLALSALFTFLWQRHRIQERYLAHLFDRDELSAGIPGAHRTRIRASFVLMVSLSTFLPIVVTALFVATGISWAGKVSELSAEQHRLFFGAESATALHAAADPRLEALESAASRRLAIEDLPVPFVAPLDVARIASGLALGLGLIVVYVFFIARWMAADLIDPVERLRANMGRAEEGDLTALTPAVTANELGDLAVGFNSMLRGLAERERIKGLFGQYLTKEISEAILDGRVNLGGARYTATVMFTDIRGFTSMSERMAPEEVFAFLNDYLDRMIEVIAARRGIIDKFLGDGILAVFGIPVADEGHASQAFAAALDMRDKLAEMNAERRARGLEPVRIGTGLHSGELIAGNVGNARKLQYTVIGDTVNLASRIEGLNKEYGSSLLLSERTHALLGPDEARRFEPLRGVLLRGKSEPIDLFRLVEDGRG